MSQRSVAPIATRREPTSAIRPRMGYLVEVAANDFRYTDDPAEATHGWKDQGSGAYVIESLVALPEPDLLIVRAGSGPFVQMPRRETRVAYLSPGMFIIERL